jgi:hypothetical protein
MMFVFDEIGQAIGPKYSVPEAVAGIVSETIYLPLSASMTHGLLGASWHDALAASARGCAARGCAADAVGTSAVNLPEDFHGSR